MSSLAQTKVLILGAGGAGVSNIAQIYKEKGLLVIGADKLRNKATENLESLGIKVYLDNNLSILDDFTKNDLVFKSSAIKPDHPLLQIASERDIKIITRHNFFQELSNTREIIAIAGSSGKTSVTALTSHILNTNRDSGYLIGIHGNGGHNGTSKEFIIEADEYAKTFLSLKKVKIGVINSITFDHVDIYPTREDYYQAFREFASNCQTLIVNGDDKIINEQIISPSLYPNLITVGYNINNDWSARNIINFEGGSQFDIYNKGNKIAEIKLSIIGGHNVINALFGFVVNYHLDIKSKEIINSLASYKGVTRRLELLQKSPYYIYDDYAHLPFEIETVLKGLRASFPTRRIIIYFQPHTYTRINSQFENYPIALSNCDILLLGDVYAARDSEGFVDMNKLINLVTAPIKYLSGNIIKSEKLIREIIKPNDVLICLNAGDGTKVAYNLVSNQF